MAGEIPGRGRYGRHRRGDGPTHHLAVDATPLPPLSGRLYRPAECRLCQVADGWRFGAQRSRLRAGLGAVLSRLLYLRDFQQPGPRTEETQSELQALMRKSVACI